MPSLADLVLSPVTLRLGVALLLGVAAVGGASADAARESSIVIRPGSSIGKFRLGMTEQELRRVAGRPTYVVQRGRAPFGQGRVEWQYGPGADYIVYLLGRPGRMRVRAVSTWLVRERTPQRVGPGSRERAVRAAYPPLRCGSLANPPLGPGMTRHPFVKDQRDCTLFSPHGTRTIFRTEVQPIAETAAEYRRRAVVTEVVVSRGPCPRRTHFRPAC